MRLRIALCDTDGDYARRIAEYARNSDIRREADITICTRPELLAGWRRERRFDLYAVGIELAGEIGPIEPEDRSVVWFGEVGYGVGPNGVPVASKYTAAPKLLRAWIERSAERVGTSGESVVVGVWSPAGGVGRTRIVAHLASAWAASGTRTFVASLEPGSLPEGPGFDTATHDVSDWLYALKSALPAQAAQRGDAWLHGFDPSGSYREWHSVGRAEGVGLLEEASRHIGRGVVLADAGAGWSPWAESVCDRADAIVCVAASDEGCLKKTEKWFGDWPEWREGGIYRAKAAFVLNRCLPDNVLDSPSWAANAFRLPYVPEWKQDASWNDALFRKAAERIAEELMIRCTTPRWYSAIPMN
ncbi:hypothetical protein [Paenibacillus sp.]|uniref:hypothetical protein n=1 Tax=Paenibacillus sp. TaxID=58172 RepID=UPI002D663208|nr:hypothetical protein [Paenibacillus sp.]HZG56030.1 hypothetical protein [Paenibacillus sp.]